MVFPIREKYRLFAPKNQTPTNVTVSPRYMNLETFLRIILKRIYLKNAESAYNLALISRHGISQNSFYKDKNFLCSERIVLTSVLIYRQSLKCYMSASIVVYGCENWTVYSLPVIFEKYTYWWMLKIPRTKTPKNEDVLKKMKIRHHTFLDTITKYDKIGHFPHIIRELKYQTYWLECTSMKFFIITVS